MATTDVQQSAAITIPAAYLEDVRTALAAEIHSDSDAILDEQKRLAAEDDHEFVIRQDRDSSVRLLLEDVRLIDQLLNATVDTEITAECGTLFHALEAMCRLLTERLTEQMEYAPLEIGAVLDLAARVRWAATEAARIYPELAA